MTFTMHHGPVTSADLQEIKARIEHDIRDHRGWYIFQGFFFLFFGFLAAFLPGVTALSADVLIGVLLVATGIVQLVASFKSRMHWWSLFSGFLSLIVGGWMLAVPLAGTLALVVTVALFLALEGVLEILLAFELRPARNWGWMLASGIASLVLFGLLWAGFPDLSVFYLGLLIAVNFIFYGISLLMLVGSVSDRRQTTIYP